MGALSFTVFVPGEPKGQPRPRAFAFNGKARVFDPGTAEGFKAGIALAVKPFLPPEPLAEPFAVNATFVFSRPKSHSTKKGLRPGAPTLHTGKPDADNVLKAICDALTGIGLWRDDSQVAYVQVRKEYGICPGVHLEVATVAEKPRLCPEDNWTVKITRQGLEALAP